MNHADALGNGLGGCYWGNAYRQFALVSIYECIVTLLFMIQFFSLKIMFVDIGNATNSSYPKQSSWITFLN